MREAARWRISAISLRNALSQAQKAARAARRLPRGAHSGQFAHDQAEVEREDAAETAFVVIDPATQGGAPHPPAVEDVGEPPLDLSAAPFEQGLAAFAFHGTGGPDHRHPGFWLMIDGLAPLGVGVTDDGAQAGRLLNDGQLSGTVEAFSPVRSFTPAGGTTFKIYLPQVEPLEVVPAGVLDLPTLPRGTESILLVEADALMRNLSAGLLRRLGYSVVAVTDAMEALQGNQRRDIAKIDLLMADVVMPSMSGMELFLKVQGSFPRLRILCTSADTRKTMVAQAPADEPWQTLQKPFAPSALAYRLREVLDR